MYTRELIRRRFPGAVLGTWTCHDGAFAVTKQCRTGVAAQVSGLRVPGGFPPKLVSAGFGRGAWSMRQ